MIFHLEETFKYSNDFQKLPSFFRLFSVVECRCQHITGIKQQLLINVYNQKPVKFKYYMELDLKNTLPPGCHQYLGNDYKDWSVKETHSVKSESYKT